MERRSHTRYCLWFPVVVDDSMGGAVAVCKDASSGGILIQSARPLGVGADVTVSFRIAQADPERRARGRVVRVERGSDNPREVWSHLLAIEFDEPQAELATLFRSASTRPPPA
jgi:hypothetical protein